MITLKFGGTSMENARRIINAADIIASRAKGGRVSVVVSAVAGVSNALQESIDMCVAGAQPEKFARSVRDTHSEICAELKSKLPLFDSTAVSRRLEPLFVEYEKLLEGCVSFGECPPTIHCRVMGMGELLVSPIMEATLAAKGMSVALLDSRKYIFTTGKQTEGDPDYAKCADALRPFRDGESGEQTRVLLFPGFVCSWTGGAEKGSAAGLLGRNGSDFSAAIIASSLGSSKVEFWTDVDGIFTADPRVVKDAILVDDMSYEEAMELAFFGSKALHPKTLAPLAAKNIEAWSLNSFKPEGRGTRIGRGPFESEKKIGDVRGISCFKRIAMISVSGPGMRGRSGMAGRVFASIASAKISALLITQSSSEYTISFCVKDSDSDRAVDALKSEFDLEIRDGVMHPIEAKKNCAIVSIVGDNMIKKRGVASRFFSSLASQDVNILAIAQGSSERCISCVVHGDWGDAAVRAAHRFFFDTAQTVEAFVFGAGTIGGALLDQIKDQRQKLLAENIDVKVMAISTIDSMILDESGIDLSAWRDEIKKSARKPSVDEIISFVKERKPLNPVFVDCTASYDLPDRYVDIFKAGMSIVTPNKRANSMKMERYRALRASARAMRRKFLYEANVGAGLPIIDTLQNLFKSGDRLTKFTGIMSGSLSYIFGRLDEDVPFSQAVREAKDLRYTEPDPRDDLNGMDVARKALIIAREAGFSLELEDVEILKVFPESFDSSGTVDEFMARLPQVDEYFSRKIAALKKEGKALRMGASIDGGKCQVGMLEVGRDDPLYGVKGCENAFVFRTERYQPIPLTVRGYGAGAAVTAAGVFGDILRTVGIGKEF